MILCSCPFCGTTEDLMVATDDRESWHVHCDRCGGAGPVGLNASDAVERWAERGKSIRKAIAHSMATAHAHKH